MVKLSGIVRKRYYKAGFVFERQISQFMTGIMEQIRQTDSLNQFLIFSA